MDTSQVNENYLAYLKYLYSEIRKGEKWDQREELVGLIRLLYLLNEEEKKKCQRKKQALLSSIRDKERETDFILEKLKEERYNDLPAGYTRHDYKIVRREYHVSAKEHIQKLHEFRKQAKTEISIVEDIGDEFKLDWMHSESIKYIRELIDATPQEQAKYKRAYEEAEWRAQQEAEGRAQEAEWRAREAERRRPYKAEWEAYEASWIVWEAEWRAQQEQEAERRREKKMKKPNGRHSDAI